MSGHPRDRVLTRWPDVEGYCDELSHIAGAVVEMRVSSRASSYSVEVARVGAHRDVVWSASGLTTPDHPAPPDAWRTGCDWPVAFSIPTSADWPSGFYEVALHSDDGPPDRPQASSEAFFVLLAPHAVASASQPTNRILVVLATNTWNAYNQWGGKCLYSGAHEVSFRRPIERGYLTRPVADDGFDGRVANIADPSDPTHERLVQFQSEHHLPLWSASAGWWNGERRFVQWAERAGFGLDVATNADLEFRPGIAEQYDVMVSAGHDEYWSRPMRDAADRFVERGGRWLILSGNTCFWQVRLDPETGSMVCFKGAAHRHDPVKGTPDEHLLTSMWSDPLLGHPESTTTGLSFTRGGYHRIGLAEPEGAGAYTVHDADHWLFEGLDVGVGDLVGEGSFVVGYEVDGCAATWIGGRPTPTHEDGAPDSLTIVASAPARLISITDDHCEAPDRLWASIDPPGDLEGVAMMLFGSASDDNVAKIAQGHAMIAHFTRGAGEVVNVGSADWCYGLDHDGDIQHITANTLRRFLARG